MSDNPYRSPASDDIAPKAFGVKSGRRSDVRSVALFQKGLLVCVLIYIILVICQFAVPENLRTILIAGVLLNNLRTILIAGVLLNNLRTILIAGVLLNGLVGAVFVILLAMKVYHPAVGILLGILTLVPCLGLLLLLIINSRATDILKQNGIRVGLMGANLSEI